jgi:hypothetical protein
MFKSVDLLHIQQIQKKSMQNLPRNGISIFDASFLLQGDISFYFLEKVTHKMGEVIQLLGD